MTRHGACLLWDAAVLSAGIHGPTEAPSGHHELRLPQAIGGTDLMSTDGLHPGRRGCPTTARTAI